MSDHEKGIEYWKQRFQRERAEALAEAKENLLKEIAALKKENAKLKKRQEKEKDPEPVQEVITVREQSTGIWPFAIGLGLGLIIGG